MLIVMTWKGGVRGGVGAKLRKEGIYIHTHVHTHMRTYGWFVSYSRDQHSIVKELPLIKNKKIKPQFIAFFFFFFSPASLDPPDNTIIISENGLWRKEGCGFQEGCWFKKYLPFTCISTIWNLFLTFAFIVQYSALDSMLYFFARERCMPKKMNVPIILSIC